ncbi:MAG: hypothetical protein Kow0010_17770 [Dehalococcoidia bacterium]
MFAPAAARVGPGTTVTFTNREGVPHTVTGAGWGSTETLDRGESLSHTFDASGVYAYARILHPGMVGAVVIDDPLSPGAAALEMSVAGDGGSGLPRAAYGVAGLVAGIVVAGAGLRRVRR